MKAFLRKSKEHSGGDKLINACLWLVSMAQLVACLSTGKGTWKEVTSVINNEKWDSIFLITNDFGKEKFKSMSKNTELIVLDLDQNIKSLRDKIKEKLKPKIKGTEVAVNFVSGSGKEHMALVSALIQLGIGIRFIAPTDKGIEEI